MCLELPVNSSDIHTFIWVTSTLLIAVVLSMKNCLMDEKTHLVTSNKSSRYDRNPPFYIKMSILNAIKWISPSILCSKVIFTQWNGFFHLALYQRTSGRGGWPCCMCWQFILKNSKFTNCIIEDGHKSILFTLVISCCFVFFLCLLLCWHSLSCLWWYCSVVFNCSK